MRREDKMMDVKIGTLIEGLEGSDPIPARECEPMQWVLLVGDDLPIVSLAMFVRDPDSLVVPVDVRLQSADRLQSALDLLASVAAGPYQTDVENAPKDLPVLARFDSEPGKPVVVSWDERHGEWYRDQIGFAEGVMLAWAPLFEFEKGA